MLAKEETNEPELAEANNLPSALYAKCLAVLEGLQQLVSLLLLVKQTKVLTLQTYQETRSLLQRRQKSQQDLFATDLRIFAQYGMAVTACIYSRAYCMLS